MDHFIIIHSQRRAKEAGTPPAWVHRLFSHGFRDPADSGSRASRARMRRLKEAPT